MVSKPPLGLDDLRRVRQVSDRGKSDLRPRSRTPPWTYEPVPDDKVSCLLGEIGQELDESKVHSAPDLNKQYIPRNRLMKILTPGRVRAIVGQLHFDDSPDKDKLTEDICFGPEPCLRLLAVLIGTGKTENFPSLLKDRMHDQCLPMEPETSPQKKLRCPHHKTHHPTVNNYRRPNDRDEFSRWSYILNAPYIKYNKEKHSHYVLHYGDVFPMEVVDGGDTPGTNDAASISNIAQFGGFSEVFKVRMEESHYDFGNVGMRHRHKLFALKRLTSHARDNFNLELSSLLFSMDNASGKTANNHLVQLLATFEVQKSAAQGSTYYLLFDWAEGNLKDYWRANSHLVGELSHSKWMAQQFHEICQAVQCVHNEREETLKSTDTSALLRGLPERPLDVHNLYGRHGDIKPDNFLWFQPAHPSSDLLALADFGLGRLHTKLSRSNQDPKKLAFTATYVAPEFELPDAKISRTSDIFSLGCVLLEYVTWYLNGLDSVENEFPLFRTAKDSYGFDADKFFVIRPERPGGPQLPFLKPKVKEWIAELLAHEKCTQYLVQLLEIIRDMMLEADRRNRIHITDLITRMADLREKCEVDPTFYLKPIGSRGGVAIAKAMRRY